MQPSYSISHVHIFEQRHISLCEHDYNTWIKAYTHNEGTNIVFKMLKQERSVNYHGNMPNKKRIHHCNWLSNHKKQWRNLIGQSGPTASRLVAAWSRNLIRKPLYCERYVEMPFWGWRMVMPDKMMASVILTQG